MAKRNSRSAHKLLGERTEKLASLENELKKRLDVHEAVIVTILQRTGLPLSVTPRLRAPQSAMERMG